MRMSHPVSVLVVGLLVLPLFAFASGEGIPPLAAYLSPVPGSINNSSKTNIIFRSRQPLAPLNRSQGSVMSVTGSLSGEHYGAAVISDDGETLVFEPFEPFALSEDVHVSVTSAIRTMHGDALGPFSFSFRVSFLSTSAQQEVLSGLQSEFPVLPANSRLAKFASDSLIAGFPKGIVKASNNPSSGALFLTSFKISQAENHQNFVSLVPSDDQYVMILDNNGKSIFSKKMLSMSTDFKLQPNGYLTYFDNAAGQYYELDSNYVVINSYSCGNGYSTDPHEMLRLSNGNTLLLGHDPEIVDMSQVVPGGQPSTTVVGAVIQELDKGKHVIFQWRSFDHFKVTDATQEDLTADVIDAVHPNAIEIDTDGNLLLSSRHLDEITKINRKTGDVIWRWGGKNNQFTYTNDFIGFSHQHSIRRTSSGSLLLFDNGNYRTPLASRAVEYSVDERNKTVRLLWQFVHAPLVNSIAMGSVQRLANGNTLIGWGSASPAMTEVRPDGSIALEIQFPDSVVSYRAFRFPWKQQGAVVSGVSNRQEVPVDYSLAQNFPNPFNLSTIIQFEIPKQTSASLKIYDIRGRHVATLFEGIKQPGKYSARFDGSRLSSGTYIYRLATSQAVLTRVMTLMK